MAGTPIEVIDLTGGEAPPCNHDQCGDCGRLVCGLCDDLPQPLEYVLMPGDELECHGCSACRGGPPPSPTPSAADTELCPFSDEESDSEREEYPEATGSTPPPSRVFADDDSMDCDHDHGETDEFDDDEDPHRFCGGGGDVAFQHCAGCGSVCCNECMAGTTVVLSFCSARCPGCEIEEVQQFFRENPEFTQHAECTCDYESVIVHCTDCTRTRAVRRIIQRLRNPPL